MEQRSWRWTDAHFCSLPSQTSIYGCTKILNNVNGTNKLLVASLVGRFFTIGYQRIFDKLTPSTKELQFKYIPGESEIVSVDATNRCRHGNGLTIGITFWKLEENETKHFLHTYYAAKTVEEFNLESVAQGCQSCVELSFMPYHLTHTELVTGANREMVFLLSGSDSKVHLYREVSYRHSFKEEESEDYFPEFKDLPSVVLWLDISYYNNHTRRITVTGHQDGMLKVAVIDTKKCEILQSFSVDFDNPITYVETFSLFNKVPRPSFLPPDEDVGDDDDDLMPELNILVLSALIPAMVYRDILRNGLSEPVFLPDSNKFDAVLTGCIIDIDFDGENEIILGTYGQEVLAYKLISTTGNNPQMSGVEADTTDQNLYSKSRHRSGDNELSATRFDHQAARRVKSQENLSSSSDSASRYIQLTTTDDSVIPSPTVKHRPTVPGELVATEMSCRLLWQRSFACPVMGINHLDIMGDGMEDLVIVTLKGLHILQPDLNEVAEVCLDRLRLLVEDMENSTDAENKTLTTTSENKTEISCNPTDIHTSDNTTAETN